MQRAVSASAAKDKRVVYNASTCIGRHHTNESVEVAWFDPKGCAMHHKFIVADNSVLFGSYNFQLTESYNHVAISDEPEHLSLFLNEFYSVWNSASSEPPTQLLAKADAERFLLAVVKHNGGWDEYTTGLSKYLRERGRLTPRQIGALTKSSGLKPTVTIVTDGDNDNDYGDADD